MTDSFKTPRLVIMAATATLLLAGSAVADVRLGLDKNGIDGVRVGGDHVSAKIDNDGVDSVRVGGDHVQVELDEGGYDGVTVGGDNARVTIDENGDACGEVNGTFVEYSGC